MIKGENAMGKSGQSLAGECSGARERAVVLLESFYLNGWPSR